MDAPEAPREGAPATTTTASARWVRAEGDARAPAAAVLAAFTRLDLLRAWMGAEAGVVEAREGGVWSLAFGATPAGYRNVVSGVIERLDEKSVTIGKLVYFSPEHGALGPTRILVETKQRSDKTIVKLTEDGFGTGDAWDRLYQDAQHAWPATLLELKRWLESGT